MIRFLSLFSGIGAFETALKRLNIPFETVAYCEIDKYASKAYSMLHGISEDLNLHDVRTADISNIRDIDLLTYGFPCQDISVAGYRKGFFNSDGSRTRSGLFFDALRIIEKVRPKYAIAENVKALTGKKFANEFAAVLNGLSDAGYNNYWSVLNAKDYGIPQNRERVFIVSIRKDCDAGCFSFPDKIPLFLRMKDFLEPSVDKKFYLTTEKAAHLLDSLNRSYVLPGSCIDDTQNFDDSPRVYEDTVPTLRAGRSIYDSAGLCPTLNTMQGGGRVTKIIEPVCAASRGRNPTKPGDRTPGIDTVQRLEINGDGVCNTLTTVQKDNYVLEPPFRIRKLTPRECWRLMGFTDSEFDSVKGISNTQLYKQAGNSIVVTVLEVIFKQLFKGSSK